MKKDLHKKRALASILPLPPGKRVVVLTGARQTGKTTLVRRHYPELNYVNLDSPENRDLLRELPTPAWASTVGNAIIDEAQKEPVVFEKVKYAYDEADVSFTVLTGSSQILLLKKIREPLAGRAFFYELWPLMQCEFSSQTDTSEPVAPLFDHLIQCRSVGKILETVPRSLLAEAEYRCRNVENHILTWGGMPALLLLPHAERRHWLKNYGYTYLERDMSDLARLDDLMPFRKFQRLSALRSGSLLNYSEIARDAGISVDTSRRYLEYLNISYQTVLLQPYYKNLTSSVIKTPKLYWIDIGILRQLIGYKGESTGQLYETMVVSEMIKWIRTRQREINLYFYRTRSGMEVDLIIETENGLIGAEIKSRATAVRSDASAMREIAKQIGTRWLGGLVIYNGKKIFQLCEPDIWAIPSRRLFQN
jgi:hypothetical protein